MRIRYDDPRAENIQMVMLDGKRLATWIEVDDKEGWAIIAKPEIGDKVSFDRDKGQTGNEKLSTLTWKYEKIKGLVVLVVKES